MGSFGKGTSIQCYWCDYWVENPYILDWIGHAICKRCLERHLKTGGGPYEPTALQREKTKFRRLLKTRLPDTVSDLIASFLRGRYEP